MKAALIVSLCLSLAACSAHQSSNVDQAGPEVGSSGTRGGGDVDAINFLRYAKEVGLWLKHAKTPLTPEEVDSFNATISTIEKKMDDAHATPIRFVDEKLSDSAGVPKMAVFTTNPLTIRVNRQDWSGLDLTSKYTLATLEIIGILGIEKRYSAANLVEKNVDAIAGIRRYADTASTTIGSDVLKGFYTFEGFAYASNGIPIGARALTGTSAGIPANVWNFAYGYELYYFEQQRFSSFKYDVRDYFSLEDSFRLDIVATGHAAFTERSYGRYQQTVFPFRSPSGTVASNFYYYVRDLSEILSLYEKNANGLEVQKQLTSLRQGLEGVLTEISASYVKDGESYIGIKNAYGEFLDAASLMVRRRLKDGNCKLPLGDGFMISDSVIQERLDESSGFKDRDLRVLFASAEKKQSDLAQRMRIMSDSFNQLYGNDKLKKIEIPEVRDRNHDRVKPDYVRHFDSHTNRLFDLAADLAQLALDTTEKELESYEHLIFEIENGNLCQPKNTL